MATGNKKSNFTINISSKEAEASIKRLKGEVEELESDLKKLDSTSSKYDSTLKRLSAVQKKLTSEENKYDAAIKSSTASHKNSINAIQQRINALRKEMNAMDMSSDAFKQKSADMRQLTASMLEGSSATGLHAASAMELGRVFSDMPYGIRGVANNISQLGSLMAQAAITTDAATGKTIGFSGAIRGLWSSLMGPLGILLAFQVVIAAIEAFSSSTKKALDAMSEMSQAGVTTMTTKLSLLVKVTNDSTAALDTKQEMVDRANGEIKGLNASLDENGRLTLSSAERIHAMTQELMKMAKAASVVDMIKELNRDLIKLQIEGLKNRGFFQDVGTLFLKFFSKKKSIREGTWANAIVEEVAAAEEKLKKQLKDLEDLLKGQDLEPFVFDPNGDGGGGSKSIKDFKDKLFDLEKFVLGLDKEMVISQEKNIRERLKLQQGYAEDELDLRLESFINSQRLRRDNFIASSKSQAEIDDANNTFNKMVEQAEGEHMMALFKMKEKNVVDTKLMEEDIKRQFDLDSQKASLERASAELDLMNDLLDEKDPRALAVLQQKQRDVWALEDAAFEEDMARKLIKLEQEGIGLEEREFLIDQERMARIADRNNAEVDMEVAKIESIKAVKLEYIGWLSSIGSTMKKLSKDNEGLAKAAVIVEKSAATAKVIASTQAANAEIMQESGAAGAKSIAQGQAAVAAGGILAANPVTAAMGAAQIAAGNASIAAAAPIAASAKGRILKNNIGAGLAIANIWAESQGSSGDAGGGSGGSGGGNSFNPNFNVVGNSETNQLAESISGQVNEPSRAYVVYEDIQNATELNANAVESVGI